MNQTTNERKIVGRVVQERHPHLVAVMDDIVDAVRGTFAEIASEVQQGNKVLVKNFGSFSLQERVKRRRYDTGLKAVVETEPIDKIQLIQSPNIFRKDV